MSSQFRDSASHFYFTLQMVLPKPVTTVTQARLKTQVVENPNVAGDFRFAVESVASDVKKPAKTKM